MYSKNQIEMAIKGIIRSLLLFSLLINSNSIILHEYDYCYKESTISEYYFETNIVEVLWNQLDNCFEYFMVNDFKPNDFTILTDSIRSQCFTYEIFKASTNEISLLQQHGCLICFKSADNVNNSMVYEFQLKNNCGELNDHLIRFTYSNVSLQLENASKTNFESGGSFSFVDWHDTKKFELQIAIYTFDDNFNQYRLNIILQPYKNLVQGIQTYPLIMISTVTILIFIPIIYLIIRYLLKENSEK